MSLRVKDISCIMDKIAPEYLKESYDNVGLIVGDMESEVTSIMIALDCTLDVIKEAKVSGCNLILTHHPLLYIKPSSITTDTLQGRKIIELIKNDISLYSSHTNLDVVSGGLGDLFCEILGFNQWQIIEAALSESKDIIQGLGRIITLDEEWALSSLCSHVKTCLNISTLRYCGHENMSVKKVALLNGSGKDYFEAAKEKGAQCIITGDTTYHYASDFSEEGIAIIDAGHFETEWPPLKLFAKKLKTHLREMNFDNRIFLSDAVKPVFKVV